jgi:hypothetical protein
MTAGIGTLGNRAPNQSSRSPMRQGSGRIASGRRLILRFAV